MTVEQLFGHDGSQVNEANFEEVFGGLHEGVFAGIANECRVVASAPAAMTVEVMTGTFVVGGVFARVSAQEVVTIGAAHAVNPRIDRIILRRDNAANLVTVEYLAGTAGPAPTPPALTRVGGVWECSLAQIYVPALAAQIDPEDVWDERSVRGVCGFATGRSAEQHDRAWHTGTRPEGRWTAYYDANVISDEGLYELVVETDATSTGGADADGVYFLQRTNNVIGVDASVVSGGPVHRRDYHTVFECKFKINQTADTRLFVGLSSITTPWDADDPVAQLAGLQYSPTVGANWQFVVKDAVALDRVDTNVAVDTGAYVLRVIFNEDEDEVYLELYDSSRALVAATRFVAADNVPDLAQILYATSGIETLANAIKEIQQYYARGINRGI